MNKYSHYSVVHQKRPYSVYTKEEAEKRGIKFVHRRKAKEGLWILTDNDFVVEVLGRLGEKGTGCRVRSYRYKTPIGILSSKDQEFKFYPSVPVILENKKPMTREYVSDRDAGKENEELEFELLSEMYCKIIIKRIMKPEKAWKMAYSLAFGRDIPYRELLYITNSLKFRRIFLRKVTEFFKDTDMNPAEIVKEWKDSLKIAKEKKELSSVIKLLEMGADWLCMKDRAKLEYENASRGLPDRSEPGKIEDAEFKELGEKTDINSEFLEKLESGGNGSHLSDNRSSEQIQEGMVHGQ